MPENITEVEEEMPENITEVEEEPVKEEIEEIINITIIQIRNHCIETCDLSKLNLNKSSYTLKIEISDSELKIKSIDYKILGEVVENITQEANITNLTTIQYQAVLGEPVKWKKNIELEKQGIARVKLPKSAENITVYQITDDDESYSEQEGTSQEDLSPSQEKSLASKKEINKTISKKPQEKTSFINKSNQSLPIGKTNQQKTKIKFSMTGKVVEKQEISWFEKIFNTMTGRVVDIEEQEDEIDVIIDEDATEFEIEYETPAPYSIEEDIAKGKRITIIGPEDVHYENILANTQLPKETPKQFVKLYRLINKTKELVNITYIDKNNNSLIDYIEWIVPYLSNQTYELEIIILNIQSYPTIGGNWTVKFNTSGQADLTITAINGTTWSNNNEDNDLKFLEIKCGNEILDYEWVNNSVFIQNYSCENQTGFETSKVLTTGKHHLEFDFGGIKAWAHNQAGAYETGIVEVNGWTIVDLRSSYDVPVVVAYRREGAEIDAAQELITAILENVSSDSFEINFYDDYANPVAGNASYIVAENGTHVLENGMLLQAGLVENVDVYDCAGASGTAARTVTFSQAYSSAPSVIANVQNNTESDWIAARYDSVSTTQIVLSMERDEIHGSTPLAASSNYDIGWISLNQTSATDMEGGIDTVVTADPTDGNWETQTFSNTYTTALFFALVQQGTGTDPTTGGTLNLTGDNVSIRMTESRTDGEQTHANEPIMWMVFESELGNAPPTTPTNITCDDSNNCNISVSQGNIVNLTASGSNDTDGDDFNYTIEAALLNTTTSDDQESGTSQAIASGGGVVIGEAGNVTISGGAWQLIAFENNYSSVPIVIATPASNNAGTSEDQNPLVIAISMINKTHLNVTLCMDAGTAACSAPSQDEILHYFVFDADQLGNYDWIDGGTELNVASAVDTASATLSFGASFAATPYVFSSAVTYNQGGNIAQHQWYTTISTSGASMFGCTHQTIGDDCDSTSPAENVSWIAIDPNNHEITGLQIGTESISNSAWTPITFSPSFTNPMIMVTQNSEGGGQDPQYPWARSVTSSGGDISYCEADGADDCDTHNPEDVRWFAVEKGNLAVGGGSQDTEATKNWTTYNNVFSNDWKNITSLNVNVSVSVYDNSGSLNNSNNNPDLQLEMYNGSDFVEVENFSIDQTGNFNLTVTDSTILTGWQNATNTDLRIRGVNFDYNNSNYIDEINWTEIWISFDGKRWTVIGNHTNETTSTLEWNTTDIDIQTCIDFRASAIDNGTNSYSDYFTKNACLNITSAVKNHAPQIIIVENDTMIGLGSGPNEAPLSTSIQINFTAYDEEGFGDLQDSYAQINFTKSGEDTRENLSCQWVADYNTNYANYTCNVTMWWWDSSGTWDITAFINDSQGESAVNDSKTFYLGTTDGFYLSLTNLTWTEIIAGGTNLEAIEQIILNNSGNMNKSIEVNTTNLKGEDNPDYALYAGNFSVKNTAGCGGTPMVWHSFENITSTYLPKGNYTTNDNSTGQEVLFFCLEQAGSELTQQAYSTNEEGAWTIRIVLVALSFRRRKRRLKKLRIPITIFSEKLGALESVVKYLKENLEISYSEIAKLLNRNDRTIWTAYHKAIGKQKQPIKIKETEIFLPISILRNRELTILESVIIYLKEKEFNYKEIAELLNRDQRNIWTIYNKAITKISENEIKYLIKEEINIPATIFSEKLGVLESVVKYLRENLGMNYHEIAELLNRDNRTIWTAYHKAIGKQKQPIKIKETEIVLSISTFRDRKFTILESIIIYLKQKGLRYNEIAKLLNRDQRNIWTIYNKAITKIKNNK